MQSYPAAGMMILEALIAIMAMGEVLRRWNPLLILVQATLQDSAHI
jgi:hypothetical protein